MNRDKNIKAKGHARVKAKKFNRGKYWYFQRKLTKAELAKIGTTPLRGWREKLAKLIIKKNNAALPAQTLKATISDSYGGTVWVPLAVNLLNYSLRRRGILFDLQ